MSVLDSDLLIHWPFRDDLDARGSIAVKSRVDHVSLAAVGSSSDRRSAALFDGRRSLVQVSHDDRLGLGKGDFAVAAWIHTESHLGRSVGDLVSKFDFERRCGFTLAVVDNQGVASSQANYRNLHMGVDDGSPPARFSSTGPLGDCRLVWALTVHCGELYAGACEPDGTGRVWRLREDDTWEDLGSPDLANSVITMASFGSRLYVGTGCYRTWGSNMPPQRNDHPGGKVYCLEDGGVAPKWRDCGRVSEGGSVNALTVYGGRLYAADFYAKGVFVMDEPGVWRSAGLDRRVVALTAYDGWLWAMLMDGGQVMRYRSDTGWELAAEAEEVTQMYGGAVHRGRLFLGGFPRAWTFRLEHNGELTRLGHPGHEAEVMGMAVYNGKLYAGTLPLANIYRFDEHRPAEFEGWPQSWSIVDTIDNTPAVSVRRAWSMCVFRGGLYCGSLPGGHVRRFESGSVATWDHSLPGGWRHIAAVREQGYLRLYVDGKLVSSAGLHPDRPMDISNEAPLMVGLGGHDYFRGAMSDLRLYGRALSPQEVCELASQPGHMATL